MQLAQVSMRNSCQIAFQLEMAIHILALQGKVRVLDQIQHEH